jgi:hypothetical protein
MRLLYVLGVFVAMNVELAAAVIGAIRRGRLACPAVAPVNGLTGKCELLTSILRADIVGANGRQSC